MQVHAVPESERAVDASGKRLPWGYEFAEYVGSHPRQEQEPKLTLSSAEIGRRREPEEKGPFGRSVRRRGFSRSKTATPARKEDVVRQENMQTEDFIFTKYKDELKAKDPVQPTQKPSDAASSQAVDAASTKEATEVILYGFGPESQWAAIEYYERISNGIVYEDYDRHPPHQRYDHSMTHSRAKLAQRSLSQDALRKRNAYRGGDHWIKVTFDSPEAADLACHCSPHPIHGFLVYAEPFRGTGPPRDAPIPYSNAGAQIDGPALPSTFSTRDTPTDSSNTISSATITAQPPSSSTLATSSSTTSALAPTTPVQKRPMRIPGATRAVLKPADLAFAEPSKSVSSSLASWPLINLFVGTKGDVIGSAVPRTDNGDFDWKNASLYWLIFAWLDYWLGTDMCGLRGDD